MDNMSTALIKIWIRQSEPGDAGYVAYMHGRYYWEHHGFHAASEYYFIKYLADFVRNPEGGRLWIAEADRNIVGSAAIVRVDDEMAQFRWFLIDENYRGKGIGSRLIKIALDFCRENLIGMCSCGRSKGWSPRGASTTKQVLS